MYLYHPSQKRSLLNTDFFLASDLPQKQRNNSADFLFSLGLRPSRSLSLSLSQCSSLFVCLLAVISYQSLIRQKGNFR